MPDHDLRTALDAIYARLQGDLQARIAELEEHQREARDATWREAQQKTADEWSGRLDTARAEWDAQSATQRVAAAAEAEQRVATEVERVRSEWARSSAESSERARQDAEAELARVRDEASASLQAARNEWQAQSQTDLQAAAVEAERRLTSEIERVRAEVEQASTEAAERAQRDAAESIARARQEATESIDRMRVEMDGAVAGSAATVREEMQQAAAIATAQLRQDMEAAAAQAASQAREEMERTIEAERARSLSSSETAVTEALALERQARLVIVEGLSSAIRSIGAARSLSDTLAALSSTAATLAPRVALFIVNGREFHGWKAEGFGDHSPANLRLLPEDGQLLVKASTTSAVVSTPTAPAPAFAQLPEGRAAQAVPITVGGQTVAVLYADDGVGNGEQSETPASWPEATQILGAHASVCLAYLTALRTTQAMRTSAGIAAGSARVAPAQADEDTSARRYARLLVSDIKMDNETAVRLGRDKRDLLERLRPQIDHARRLYELRVPSSVGQRHAYFQQELIRTLADGDAALLGGTV